MPDSVVLRFPPFMEVWLALVGSSLPLRGERFGGGARRGWAAVGPGTW